MNSVKIKPPLLQPNALMRRLYPRAVWKVPGDQKNIYLTFDDGPIPELTDWVLDELKKFNASATFFCVGENIKKQPVLFKRLNEEGHTTANHTMHHIKGFRHSVSSYMQEVNECRKLVNNNLFRPPYGQLRFNQYKALINKGYSVIMWDVISYDYENISPEQCASNVLRRCKAGSLVLFHDNIKAEKNLKYALPKVLEHFSEKGFQFRALQSA